jgi:hypothetical protein
MGYQPIISPEKISICTGGIPVHDHAIAEVADLSIFNGIVFFIDIPALNRKGLLRKGFVGKAKG